MIQPTSLSIQEMTTGDSLSDSFTYFLIDAAGQISDTVVVSLNVAGVNDAPILVPDLAFLEMEGSTSIRVLDNDRDVDGSIDPTSVEIIGEPEFGTIVVTDAGVILYTPFVDIPAQHSFAYTVADDLGRYSEPLTVMISTNPAPTTGDDIAGTFQGEPILVNVLANDSDADGLNLSTLVIVSGPARGQATVQSDGTVLYEPDAEFAGSDSFTYMISDTLGRPSRVTTVNSQVVSSRLQNPRRFEDVNADGSVTALDALLIINHLRNHGNVSEVPVLPTDRGPNYYDVNGNQLITAGDALRVVNALRSVPDRSESQPASAAAIQSDAVTRALNLSVASEGVELAVLTKAGTEKIIDTTIPNRVSRELIDAIAQEGQVEDDKDLLPAAIDAAMAELI